MGTDAPTVTDLLSGITINGAFVISKETAPPETEVRLFAPPEYVAVIGAYEPTDGFQVEQTATPLTKFTEEQPVIGVPLNANEIVPEALDGETVAVSYKVVPYEAVE